MVYRGHIKNGAVVLDEDVNLPEGAEVEIEVLKSKKTKTTLGQRLMRHAGKIKGTPPDFAHNHDHYIHGTPKK